MHKVGHMERELEQLLYTSSKRELIQLIQELIERYPAVLPDMASMLTRIASTTAERDFVDESIPDETGEEATEDWDFAGDEASAITVPTLWKAILAPLDSEACQQHIESFAERLTAGEPLQIIAEEVTDLLEEAELRVDQHDIVGALDIYALLLDERLSTRHSALALLLGEAIDGTMTILENLLSEASSNAMFDTRTVSLSPLLTPVIRHQWLERLFALWLKHLDVHRMEDTVPEIMLAIAWNEDLLLLSNLGQQELQRLPRSEHANIVDLHRQFRTRALERFLRMLPRTY